MSSDIPGLTNQFYGENVVDITKRQSAALAERLMEICALYTLSKNLSLTLSVDTLFTDAEKLLKSTLNINDFSILLLDPSTNKLTVWRADQKTLAATSEVTFDIGEGIVGQVAQTGTPRLVPDVSTESGFLYYKGFFKKIGSFFSTPLTSHSGEILGVFNIHKPLPNSIEKNELPFYTAAASHVAQALENSKLFSEVRQLSITDELTGLYTRRYFSNALRKEIATTERTGAPLSVVMFDIDNFKNINDTFGHPVGDMVLREIAEVMAEGIRRSDICARYGGEEFILLLPGADPDAAFTIAEKIRAVVEVELVLDIDENAPLSVTLSGGVATLHSAIKDGLQFIKEADDLLLKAKTAGKNRILAGSVAAKPPKEVSRERRRARRCAVGLSVRADNESVRFIDFQHQGQWVSCQIHDISRAGFSGFAPFGVEEGEIYQCRAVIAGNQQSQLFSVKCTRNGRNGDDRKIFGAQIVENISHWERTASLIGAA